MASDARTERITLTPTARGETRWAEVRRATDRAIREHVAGDPEAVPWLDARWFVSAHHGTGLSFAFAPPAAPTRFDAPTALAGRVHQLVVAFDGGDVLAAARRIGVSGATLRRLIFGKAASTSLAVAMRIAMAYGVSLDALAGLPERRGFGPGAAVVPPGSDEG